MDDANIASIRATAYEKHIDNITDNKYCYHFYNMPSEPDIELASSMNQKAEISKIMVSIGSVTTSDTPCELFSDPIIGQLE